MLILPPLRPDMAMLNPCPSTPIRFSTGTSQSYSIKNKQKRTAKKQKI
jgi:hypothetical protein